MMRLDALLERFHTYWSFSMVDPHLADDPSDIDGLDEEVLMLITAAEGSKADAFMPVCRLKDSNDAWRDMRDAPYRKIGYAKGMITQDKRINQQRTKKYEYAIHHIVYAVKQIDYIA